MHKFLYYGLCTVFFFMGCTFSFNSLDDFQYVRNPGEYWIHTANGFERRKMTLEKTGEFSELWVESGMYVSQVQLNKVISDFDTKIYKKVKDNFANPMDINNDGKLAIVIYKGGDGNAFTGGYFSYVDFFKEYSTSNFKDAIYVNGEPLGHRPGSEPFANTLAHEFQHLCNFSRNVMEENDGDITQRMFTWMDEGLAENAGSMSIGESSGHVRLHHFQYDEELRNGDRSLTIWDKDVDNYSLAYMYFAYLRGRLGDSILKKIIDHENGINGTSDVNAVLEANTALDELKGLNKSFVQFVTDLREKSGFPQGFFPTGFTIPQASKSTNNFRPYSFIYANNFTAKNETLSYFDKNGNPTEFNSSPVLALYLDDEGSTWNSQNYTGSGTSTFAAQKLTTKLYSSRMIETDTQIVPQKIDAVIGPQVKQ